MDPQGRILLEQTGLALADASTEKLFSSFEPAMGVYVGVMHMEYIQFMSGIASREWLDHSICKEDVCFSFGQKMLLAYDSSTEAGKQKDVNFGDTNLRQ